MGMTNRQFQAFLRAIKALHDAIEIVPEDKKQEMKELFNEMLQSMLEDGTD